MGGFSDLNSDLNKMGNMGQNGQNGNTENCRNKEKSLNIKDFRAHPAGFEPTAYRLGALKIV